MNRSELYCQLKYYTILGRKSDTQSGPYSIGVAGPLAMDAQSPQHEQRVANVPLRRVLMVSTSYRTGGAEHSAADLLEALQRRNIECRMFVGMGSDPRLGLYPIPPRSKILAALLTNLAKLLEPLKTQSALDKWIYRRGHGIPLRSRIAPAEPGAGTPARTPRRIIGWYILRLAQATSFSPISSRLSQLATAVSNASAAGFVRYLQHRIELPVLARRSIDYLGWVGSSRLLATGEPLPDLLHAHNLHGGPYRRYFDLRALPSLSSRVPFVLSLRDAWTMSGHCGHSMGCDRWQSGCGRCPDLTIYPEIPRDRTAKNWREKRDIYRASRLYVHALSNWIKERAERSILADGIRDLRVIHTGIDRRIFRPRDKAAARQRLGLPTDRHLLAFSAINSKENEFKDLDCLRACLASLGNDTQLGVTTLVAMGQAAATERFGSAELIYWPYTTDRDRIADLYSAAEIYLHAAKADTFPRAILESLACGTPVIATAVGGIPEQIRSLHAPFAAAGDRYSENRATGVLVKEGDGAAMAAAVRFLISNPACAEMLGENAAADAADRFDLEQQTDKMLCWYKEIILDFHASMPAAWDKRAMRHAAASTSRT